MQHHVSLALILLVTFVCLIAMEVTYPTFSFLLLTIAFMVLYVMFLTVVLVVKRYRAKKKGINLEAPLEGVEVAELAPFVSVVIPAHNEASVIEASVLALLEQTYPNFEILVMDDRSTDGTAEVLAELKAKLEAQATETTISFSFHTRPSAARPGKSAVLNDALALTRGEYLLIFDADARVASTYIANLVPYLEPDNVVAVQSRKMILHHENSLLLKCQQWEYTFDAHLQRCRDLAGSAVELRGNGQMVKRSAVVAVGGWNEASITDDLDLSTRFHLAGFLIRFSASVQVWEEGVLAFWSLIKQRCRWAEGSLRRYLDFGGDILNNRSVMLRTRADMFAYWVNFLFPLIVAAEYIVVGVSTLLGKATLQHQLISVGILPLFVASFIPTIYVSLRRFGGFSRLESFKGSFLTGLFMVGVWIPVVFFVFAKVLLKPNAAFHWEKTEHGVANQATDERDELPLTQEPNTAELTTMTS
ncbi:MAG: glycosyltransferase family 2 protein [Candidatus Melainabacteria bacterium]|nr:glycosyltransferase family 2 protein [Candidatus Melainabacteria bacterium]